LVGYFNYDMLQLFGSKESLPRRGNVGGLKPKPSIRRPPKPRARKWICVTAAQKTPAQLKFQFARADAHDYVGADQAEIQHRAGSRWPPIWRGGCWRGSAAPGIVALRARMWSCLDMRAPAFTPFRFFYIHNPIFTMPSFSPTSVPVRNYLWPREIQEKFNKPLELVL
jgi:hypothetical protein